MGSLGAFGAAPSVLPVDRDGDGGDGVGDDDGGGGGGGGGEGVGGGGGGGGGEGTSLEGTHWADPTGQGAGQPFPVENPGASLMFKGKKKDK